MKDKKTKVCYILPFFDEKTDTHLFYNYELIKESAKNLNIFLILERAKSDPGRLGCGFKVQKFKNPVLRFLELLFYISSARLRGYTNFYTHYSYYGALASWLVVFIFGGKAFYWNRGMPWLFKRGFLEEKTFRFILRHTILVTGPESLAKEYQKIYGVKKYALLSNWIDFERYSPQKSKEEYKKDLGLDTSKKYVLFVHHLSERKGADFILPVADKFGESTIFLVAGEGPYMEKLKNQNLKTKNLVLLGKISQSEVKKYFHASDIFFMPSREEGSPHVILEAMASGTPFVASQIGGISEIVSPSAQEFLCPVGNIECFAEKISKLLSDSFLCGNIRGESLDFVKNFSKEKAVQEFAGLFSSKIYYVANARFPTEKAHGIQMAKMIEAMVGSGADIEVIAPKRGAGGDAKEFYGLRRQISVTKLPVLNTYASGKLGFWAASISFAWGYWLFLVWKKVRGEKFIVYTIDIDQFSFFMVPFIGVPYFVEVHDAKKNGFFFNQLFQKASGVVVINSLIKETLIEEFKLCGNKIIVHPNGIDLAQFDLNISRSDAKSRLQLLAGEKIALYVGKFYEWKGMDILAEAAKKTPEIKFYLVGGSKNDLIKATKVEHWPENIICAGQRDFKEIPLWLKAADALLVLGTRKNEYSFKHTSPMKMFEYMASHTPIVASATPAILQIAGSAEVVFYEPDNAGALAEKIRHTMSNAPETKFLADAAYKKVKMFSWDKRATSVLEFTKMGINRFKIGITLHPYGEKKPAGLGRAAFDIVRSLLEIDGENEYTIFLKNPALKINLPADNWRAASLTPHAVRRLDVCVFNTPIIPWWYGFFGHAKKSVVIAYDFAYLKYSPNFLLKLYHRYSLWRADLIISISEFTKNEIIKIFKIPEKKIEVIYLGYKKIGTIAPAEIAGLPEKFFLFIGAIKERKNVLGIVESFNTFKKNHQNNYRLVIAGNGSGAYYGKIIKFIEENNLKNDVIFLGQITDNQLSCLYKKAEALVYPSFIEGFGFPVLEAMDAGLPVITSNASSLPEVAGEAALLVDPSGINEMASAMARIVSDPNLRADLIRRGYEQVKKFSWQKTAEDLKRYIGKLC